MLGKKGNSLIVIENGQLTSYQLDDKLVWEVGRPSKDNNPDIKLHSTTVSRQHGRFQNLDGMWFYLDKKGKNGTVYNGKHVTPGIRGRVKPITLKNGDILIFGGGEEAIINSKTIWTMFSERRFDERWRVEDTKGLNRLSFTDGNQSTVLAEPVKGTVIEKEEGIAIYMGDITYLIGNIAVMGI
ncbi:MAG: FHA domain-containing protein [Lachnospiraceae bacterium]|nr:FHA domain-containing protein [Lachnospiraceae bacterium]